MHTWTLFLRSLHFRWCEEKHEINFPTEFSFFCRFVAFRLFSFAFVHRVHTFLRWTAAGRKEIRWLKTQQQTHNFNCKTDEWKKEMKKKMKMTTTEKEIIFEWKKTTKKKVHKSIGAMRYGWISSSNDETAHERCEKFSRLLNFQVSSDAKVVSYFKNVVVVAHVSLVDTQLLSHCIVMTKWEKERAKERALKTSK